MATSSRSTGFRKQVTLFQMAVFPHRTPWIVTDDLAQDSFRRPFRIHGRVSKF